MTRSSATNTLPLYVSQPTPSSRRNSIPGHEIARLAARNSISAKKSAGRVADQLDTVAVPPELHHAVEALDAAGVPQRDGVAGGGRVIHAVEPVGVRHAGGEELAEEEQNGTGVRAVGGGVGADE